MHILYIMDIIHDNGYIMDMQWTCISYSSVSSLSKTGSGLHVGNPPGGPRWMCGGSLEWNAVEAIASGRGALSHDRRHPLQTLRQNYAIAAATPWDFHGDLMEFLMGLLGYMMGYPPVMTNRLLLKMAIYSEFSHYKRWNFHCYVNIYQRVTCFHTTASRLRCSSLFEHNVSDVPFNPHFWGRNLASDVTPLQCIPLVFSIWMISQYNSYIDTWWQMQIVIQSIAIFNQGAAPHR